MEYREQPQRRVPLPPLPNSTTVLVLGILSVVVCCCFGIAGLVTGIIALVAANKASREYADNFGRYSEQSYKNMQAGRVCAIVGTCLSAIVFAYYLVYTVIIGTISSFIPWKAIFNGN